MPGNDQQIIQLYMAVTGLLSFLSLVMYLVCAIVVLANGRASIERTLIGIGAALHAIGVALSLGFSLFQRAGFQQGSSQLTIYLFYGLANVITFVGTAVGLYGSVRLLNRASQMELLLEDPDDDR
jgi:hypothetical protein